MRIDAAKNNIDAEVWVLRGSPRVHFRVGWQKYTATVEEAGAFAANIMAAVAKVREREGGHEDRG